MNPTRVSDAIVQEIAIKGSAEPIYEALTNPGQRLKSWGPKDEFKSHRWSLTSASAATRPASCWD
jgi:hypothetical protein